MNIPSTSTLSILFLLAGPASAAAVSSDFSVDADGWTVVTVSDIGGRPNFASLLQTGLAPEYHAAGGELGGYISIADPDEGWTYFAAPGKFLGDQSENLGGSLIFSLTQSLNGGSIITPTPPHVVLQNADTALVLDFQTLPAELPDWRSYAADLNSGLWRVGSAVGPVATAEQLAAVLGNLSGLYIVAEFVTPVVEVNGLDSVAMQAFTTPVPLPAAGWLLAPAIASLGTLRRQRQTGRSVTE